jgi:adhesin HecA-like repeat protein
VARLRQADALRGGEDPVALDGIDVSNFQDGVDWNAVAAAGIRFAIAKVSEGNGFEDPAWASNAGPLDAPGPITAGAYHFARPDLGNAPEAEADWFWQRLTSRVNPRGWLLALDLETGSGDLGGWRDRFCERVSSLAGGYVPGWYTFWDFAQSNGLNVATPFWTWLAWPDTNGPLPQAAFTIDFQQFGTRSVPGIAGAVDADRFFGDAQQLAAHTVGGGKMVQLDPNDPVVVDLQNRIGGLIFGLVPPSGGFTSQGEVTLRVRSIDNNAGPVIQGSIAALKTELDAIRAALQGSGGAAVDLTKVYAQLANLGKHLGVDVTTGNPT